MQNEQLALIQQNIQRKMVGNDRVIRLLLTSLLSGGHVLLEDTPGSGKTVLAKSAAQSMDLVFKRIQFTPDLLPTDITGLNIFDRKEQEFVFHPGPAFCNILLADEINRATPRTQAGLLECMEEKQVTVDGKTMKLEAPFLVIATQNPVETAGTFPLPEAQIDRFFMQLSMDAIVKKDRRIILERALTPEYNAPLGVVCDRKTLLSMQNDARGVFVHPELLAYIVDVVEETKNIPSNLCGVSHRGLIALLKASQSYAYLSGREYVVPEDVKDTAVAVLSHRLLLDYDSRGTVGKESLIGDILGKVPVPTEQWKRT